MALSIDADARQSGLSLIKAIFDSSLSDDALTFWINSAYPIVDRVENNGTDLAADELKRLEALVAAHMAASQDQRAESLSSASRSVSYQGETGMGFQSTTYGQRALSLDDTGTLAGSDKPSASVSVPDIK